MPETACLGEPTFSRPPTYPARPAAMTDLNPSEYTRPILHLSKTAQTLSTSVNVPSRSKAVSKWQTHADAMRTMNVCRTSSTVKPPSDLTLYRYEWSILIPILVGDHIKCLNFVKGSALGGGSASSTFDSASLLPA